MYGHANDCPRTASAAGICLCDHQKELERQNALGAASEAKRVACKRHRLTKENGDKYRAAAKRRWGDEGFVEIDDDAKVTRADDSDAEAEPGAYVQAWVWVDNAEAGIK